LRVSWILFQNKRHGGSSSDTMALQLTTLIASSLAPASKPKGVCASTGVVTGEATQEAYQLLIGVLSPH
jgi:hypothetical protein